MKFLSRSRGGVRTGTCPARPFQNLGQLNICLTRFDNRSSKLGENPKKRFISDSILHSKNI